MTDESAINPFPGLRPFKTEERYLFFGREGQSETVLLRLRDSRLVVLVGPSGSGKSSLINAGLLPYLYGGFLADAGSHWRVATCRPGNDPIGKLAAALCAPKALGPTDPNEGSHANDAALMEVTLRGSSLGLIDAVRLASLLKHEQIIIIVDQFEELFRFARLPHRAEHVDDAAAFVKLLLEATRQRELPIYIVLGLRSDYIGDCARFRDLPEAVMSTLFLIPRMLREHQREAIEGPVRVGGGTITPRLVTRLLNDVSDNPDQLPILQHALMRTWEHWRLNSDKARAIDLDDYNAIGGMAKALSVHADDAYEKLPDDRRRNIARLAFECLSGTDVNSREARRPASVATIAAVASVDPWAAIDVINHFRRPDRGFLTPQWGGEIDDSSIIDISHESLIRGWDRLRGWVAEEAESAKTYCRLAEAAALHSQGKEGLWDDPELQLALDWRSRCQPTAAWAQRYNADYTMAMRFLDDSRDARDALRDAEEKRRAHELRFQRHVALGAMAAAVVIAAICIFAWIQKGQADAALTQRLQAQDLYLASLAEQWTRAGDAGAALPLALEILPDATAGTHRLYYPQAELQLEKAIRHLHERLVLMADKDPMLSAAFSRDGKRIVTASTDGTARIWDAETGKPIGNPIVAPEGSAINDALFDANANSVAIASGNTARLVEVASGITVREFEGHQGEVRTVAFNSDGSRLVTASADGKACVWNIQTSESICTPILDGRDLRSAAFSPDGAQIVTGSVDGMIRIWKSDTMAQVKTSSPMQHGGPVTEVTYTPNGAHIVSSSSDKTAAVWDVTSGAKIREIALDQGINSVAVSPDGRRIVTASSDNITRSWDMDTGEPIDLPFKTDITAQGWQLHRVAFDRDGRRIVTASDDGTVRVWDLNVEKSLPIRLTGHGGVVYSATFAPDGMSVVTASDDHIARLWDAVTGHSIREFDGHTGPVLDASFSPDGTKVITGSADGSARIWTTDTGQPIGNPFKAPDGGRVNTAVFSPDAKYIVAAYEKGSVWMWNIETGQRLLGPLGKDAIGARSAVFSRDGRQILSAHQDGTARIWNADTGKQIAQTPAAHLALRRAAYNSDDTLVVTASADGVAQIWDAHSLIQKQTIQASYKILYSAVFSPNDHRILTASEDKSARLFDTETGQLIDEPFTSGADVLRAEFAPDGKSIVTASAGRTVLIWPVFPTTEMLMQHAKAVAPRCLTPSERKNIALLAPNPDPWCIKMRKWPFQSEELPP
jgi:WD40 repeat protein/energy-coupling factor transporter ATP-binding protein EcfA2